jgi:hypothetical protein
MRLRKRSAEDREILTEDEDRPAMDASTAGDNSIAERTIFLESKVVRTMSDEHIELFEGAFVKQERQTFSRRELAFGVLIGNTLFPSTLKCIDTKAMEQFFV